MREADIGAALKKRLAQLRSGVKKNPIESEDVGNTQEVPPFG